jgi:hypothetical protein
MRAMCTASLVLLLFGQFAKAETGVSFSKQVLPVLMKECGYCHMREERYGYLVIDPESAYTNLVGIPAHAYPKMKRVQPGAPERSYLWLKITGEYLALGGEGWRMPFGPVSPSDTDLIRLWIQQGAPNN